MSNQNSKFQTKLQNGIRELVESLEREGEDVEGFSVIFKGENKEKWKKGCHFIKLYNEELAYVIRDLNLDSYELSTLLILFQYVEYETNLIANKGKALNKSDLMKVLGFGRNKTEKIMNSLVKKRILSKTKVGRSMLYHMNPYVAFRGTFLSPETQSIFR